MKKTLILLASVTLAIAASTASAGPHRGHGGPHGGPGDGMGMGMGMGMLFHVARHIERVADELGVTDAQRDEIRSILDGAREQARPMADALRDNRQALMDASAPESYDDALVAQLADAQGDLISQMIVLKSRTRANVLTVLTPEQRTQLEAMREERRSHRFGG